MAPEPTTVAFPVTGDPAADQLLVDDPFALLLGMLLDQQVPMEWAFRGPYTLRERVGGALDPASLATMGPDAVEAAFREKPALHRYPASMGKRAHALAQHVVDEYDGDAARIWTTTSDAGEVYARLRALPGFGEDKAKIFLAVLGKRFGVAPKGWERDAAPFSDSQPRSVADVDSAAALQRVRAFKQEMKRQGKGKAD